MNKSESITELAAALSKFQGEVSNPTNTATNPFFNSKYAPLNEVLNTIRPVLSKHGLSIVQAPSGDGNNIIVTTTLFHSSGEYIEFPDLVLKADKATAQGAGSAISYGRRYALSAILGISSEDDDDGNNAEPEETINNKNKNYSKATNSSKSSNTNGSLATEAQVKYIGNLMKKKNYNDDSMNAHIKNKYNKDDLKTLDKKEAGEVINMLNEI